MLVCNGVDVMKIPTMDDGPNSAASSLPSSPHNGAGSGPSTAQGVSASSLGVGVGNNGGAKMGVTGPAAAAGDDNNVGSAALRSAYSIPGILHFIQHEWARFEMERSQWEVERAELQVSSRRLLSPPLTPSLKRPSRPRLLHGVSFRPRDELERAPQPVFSRASATALTSWREPGQHEGPRLPDTGPLSFSRT